MERAYQEEKVFYACGTPVIVAENEQGETHVYRESDREQLSTADMSYGTVFGGTKGGECDSTSVTMESGFLCRLFGGSDHGTVKGSVSVTLVEGMIGDLLYGAGVGDRVLGDIHVTTHGGAVKIAIAGGGAALECHNINMKLHRAVATGIFTGIRTGAGVQHGGTTLLMEDGVTLSLHLGGSGVTEGEADVTVTGGYIEKQIILHRVGDAKVRLYEGIQQPNGHETVFPLIPEGLEIEWLIGGKCAGEPVRYTQVEDGFFDTDEKGKLTLRFFEVRDPEVPKYAARFPQFIGDATLVHFPSGEYMLIDTGLPYAREELVSGLRALGIKKLDYLQGTHYHHDHIGCAAEILRNFEVGTVILPKIKLTKIDTASALAYIDLFEEAETRKVPILRVSEGDSLTVGRGRNKTQVEFLNPEKPWMEMIDLNRESIATRITFRQNAVMLGGDISDPIEKGLAEKYGEGLRCDLLKLSHHAIVYQTYPAYIDACAPKYVVTNNLREEGVFFSVTKYQLERVHRIPSERIFITGIHGRIKATLDGTRKGVSISTKYR